MNNVQIFPIFKQTQQLWDVFANIETYTTQVKYNYKSSDIDIIDNINSYKNGWEKYSHNFAFGAYENGNMVGFLRGSCHDSMAIVMSLYVLPKYNGRGIATAMLQKAEQYACLNNKLIGLIALSKAESFYKDRGYEQDINSNKLVKNVNFSNSVNCVIPVFKITDNYNSFSILRKNKSSFYKQVNQNHCPCFINVGHNNISGYIFGQDEIKFCYALANPKQTDVKNNLIQTFNNFFEHFRKEKFIAQAH